MPDFDALPAMNALSTAVITAGLRISTTEAAAAATAAAPRATIGRSLAISTRRSVRVASSSLPPRFAFGTTLRVASQAMITAIRAKTPATMAAAPASPR